MHPKGRNGVEQLASKLAWSRAPARTSEPESPLGSAGDGETGPSSKPLNGRGTRALSSPLETRAETIALRPRWMDRAAEMLRMSALVRFRCAKCGTLLRADIVARHGGGVSLVDRMERCRIVGCAGSTFYLASRQALALGQAHALSQALAQAHS